MDAGAVSSNGGAWMMQVLQAAQQSQVDIAEKLIAAGVQTEISADQMAIAGQIIDTYA